MSVMDKLINAMKFNDDEDFDEDEEYEDMRTRIITEMISLPLQRSL